MWKLIDKPKTQKVTKKLATEFAEMDPAPHDRPLSERRLNVYRKLLTDGAFRPVTWASALCVETGGVYRVNGKHTSVLLSSLKELPEFYVVIEEYECDTLEDVAKLYATFDSKMQSRTTSDINASFAATVPELAEIGSRCVCLAVSGMSYHLGTYTTSQPAERAELMLEYTDFVVWLSEIFYYESEESSGKHIRKQPVVAAMFGCWLKSKSAATDFWKAVRNETGPKPDCPDRKLASYLLRTTVNRGQGSRNSRHADIREVYVKSIHAWNAWRKGEPTALRYMPEADIPSFK